MPINSPTEIPGLQGFYHAKNTSSVPTNVSNVVLQWDDLSGNARNLDSVTGSPLSGARTYNDHNVIDFQAGADYIDRSTAIVIAQPYTLIVFGAIDVPPGQLIATDSTTNAFTGIRGTTTWIANSGTDLSGGTVDTDPHRLMFVANGSSSELILDGASLASGDAGSGSFSLGKVGVGAFSVLDALDGFVGSWMIYDRVLTSTELSDLDQWLVDEWATAISGESGISLGPGISCTEEGLITSATSLVGVISFATGVSVEL